MEMNRMPKMNNLHSNNYSGNRINNNTSENKNFSNNYSNNLNQSNDKKIFSDTYNIKKDNFMHEYKGIDGRVYYTEEALDIANRKYLEDKNKGD